MGIKRPLNAFVFIPSPSGHHPKRNLSRLACIRRRERCRPLTCIQRRGQPHIVLPTLYCHAERSEESQPGGVKVKEGMCNGMVVIPAGFDWEPREQIVEKLNEKLDELRMETTRSHQAPEPNADEPGSETTNSGLSSSSLLHQVFTRRAMYFLTNSVWASPRAEVSTRKGNSLSVGPHRTAMSP